MVGVGACDDNSDAYSIEELRKAVGAKACQELAAACREDRGVARALWGIGWAITLHDFPFSDEVGERFLSLGDDGEADKLVIVATACAAPDDVFERIMRLLEAP